MNTLFPHRLKFVSGLIFYLTLPIAGYLFFTEKLDNLLVFKVLSIFPEDTFLSGSTNPGWFTLIENAFLDEILTAILIASGIIHVFSKEKIEDELITKIRLDSLVFSLYLNYGLLLVANFLVFGIAYFNVMSIHLFSLLVVFNISFRIRLAKHYKATPNE